MSNEKTMNSQQLQEPPTMMQCAMNMGAVVGVYYIGKFCLFPLSLHSTMAAMLFLGLTLMVPFLIYRLVKLYRDRYLDGDIEFARALAFALLIMGFGSLLAAAAHYIYFAYIDGGAMIGAFESNIAQLTAIDLSTLEGVEGSENVLAQWAQYIELMRTIVTQLQAITPIEMTMGMLSNNISWAIVIALPITLFISMRKSQKNS